MFDFLRDLRKSEEDKNQEALTAYLDNALTPAEKERFEQLLATDESLRASLEEQRLIGASMRRLPRMRAPRNFTLDPALYGRPVSSSAYSFYPVLRAATAIVAILFVIVLVLDFAPSGATDQVSELTMADTEEFQMEAMEAASAAEAPAPMEPEAESIAGEALVVTRELEAVTRVVEAIEEAVEMAAEAPVAEAPVAEAERPAEEMDEEVAQPAAAENTASGGGPADEAPPAGEGQAAAPEADTAAGQDGEALALPLIKQGERQLADALGGTATAAGEMAMTEEALPNQPTPSQAARAIPAVDDDAADFAEAETEETASAEAAGGLSTLQIVAIILGLCLIALALASLAVRRSLHQKI